MSGAATIAAAAAVAGTAYSIYSGERAAKKQEEAQRDAKAAALKAEKQADEQINAANRKTPNTQTIMDRASQMGKSGPASTILTGNKGVDPNTLTLGRNTLLGA